MFATLLFGIIAGAGASYAEPHVKKMVDGAGLGGAPITAVELRTLSFALCLLLAAFVALIFGGHSAFGLALGAVIGVFGPRSLDRIQKRREPDYGPDPRQE